MLLQKLSTNGKWLVFGGSLALMALLIYGVYKWVIFLLKKTNEKKS